MTFKILFKGNKNMRRIIICFICLALSVSLFFGDSETVGENSPPQSGDNFVKWRYPIAVKKSSTPEIQAAASRLSKLFRSPLGVLKSNQNPICCFWLEVGTWTPNPGEPGYLIMIQPGGALLMATNIQQLNRAVDKLTKIKRVQGENTLLPVGVISSYPVIGEK